MHVGRSFESGEMQNIPLHEGEEAAWVTLNDCQFISMTNAPPPSVEWIPEELCAVTCIHRMCRHSSPGTPRQGGGLPSLSLQCGTQTRWRPLSG